MRIIYGMTYCVLFQLRNNCQLLHAKGQTPANLFITFFYDNCMAVGQITCIQHLLIWRERPIIQWSSLLYSQYEWGRQSANMYSDMINHAYISLSIMAVFLYKNIIKHRVHTIVPWYNDYNDVIMGAIASQITSLPVVYSIVYSDADQRKHQSSASLVFVRGIHRGPVNFPHKRPVTLKVFPFDDVFMLNNG